MNESEQEIVERLNFNRLRIDPDDEDSYGPPRELCHYTSANGLLGIISSRKLWGSNYSYLNDSSELEYGRELADRVIREKLAAEDNEDVRSFFDEVRDSLAAKAVDFYLTCFCMNRDVLSMWRAYGTPSSGRFCIVFNTDHLANTLKLLKICTYEEDKQRCKVERALDEARGALMKGRSDDKSFRTAIADRLVQALIEKICFFKDSGFKEEREWRMVHFAPDASEVHFQASVGLLKPFVDMITVLDDSTLPITEIWAGKSRVGPLAQKSVELLLKRYGYGDVEVQESAIPLREF